MEYNYVVQMVSEGHFIVAVSLRIGSAHRTEYSSVIIDRKIPLKYSKKYHQEKIDSFSTNFSLLYYLRYGLFDTSFSMALLYIYGTVNALKNTYEVLN